MIRNTLKLPHCVAPRLTAVVVALAGCAWGALAWGQELVQRQPGRLSRINLAQQRTEPPPNPTPGGPTRLDLPPMPPLREPGGSADPTQASPDVRRILEGEGSSRSAGQNIQVAAKIVAADGTGKALLRIGDRYLLVAEGSRFRVNDTFFTVDRIDRERIDLRNDHEPRPILLD